MNDVVWTETNNEFGDHNISHHDTCAEKAMNCSKKQDNDSQFHKMEFEFDELDSTIVLRGKSNISHSTGLTIWTCSQVLSGFLLDNPHYVKDQNVLELGAGVGLASIVAHHLGADRVLSTDGDVRVLENLRHNIQNNCLSFALQYDEGEEEEEKKCEQDVIDKSLTEMDNNSPISCPQLVWGKRLNEFQDTYGRQSILLGTDIFYNNECVDLIWKTVDHLLEDDGSFLLAFAPHKVKMNTVLEKAQQFGFSWIKPNISDDGNDEEDDMNYINHCSFGYHIFVFQRDEQ
jgi:predicted nicotinamide N-methyase